MQKLPNKKIKDLSGKVFGRLQILEFVEIDKFHRAVWRCRCECSTIIDVTSCSLRSGNTESCGCKRKQTHELEHKNLTGKTFKYVKVISFHPERDAQGNHQWRCLCVCGNYCILKASYITHGKNVSCGCKRFASNKAPGEVAINRLFDRYEHGAKSRGIRFDLTRDEIYSLAQQNCFYCGCEPSQSLKKSVKNLAHDMLYNGIDRTDNTMGYQFDNCRGCCGRCNTMKSDMSEQEFLSLVRKIVVKHGLVKANGDVPCTE